MAAVLLALLGLAMPGPATDVAPAAPVAVEALRADIAALADNLGTLHPQPFAFVSEADFDALTDRLVAEVNEQTSQRDILWAFSELIASIGCGHTALPFFKQEDALIPAAARFPADVTLVDGRLFVVDPLANAGVLEAHDEITAINDIPAHVLVAVALRHISADGHNPHTKAAMFRVSATSYLTYVAGFPSTYTVTIAGKPSPIELAPLETFQHRPVVSPNARCQDTLCLDELGDGVVLMTIRSWDFYGDRQVIFKTFIDESFASFRKAPPTTLIIDVRKNLGGSGFASAYLLRHLARTEFRYFHPDSSGAAMLKQPLAPIATDWSGDVVVLTDELTHSSTGHFLSLVKAHKLGLIVGRPSGAGSEVNDNSKRLVSEHSGIEYKVARNTFFTDLPGHDTSTSIAPDLMVPLTLGPIIDDRDTVLEHALSYSLPGVH